MFHFPNRPGSAQGNRRFDTADVTRADAITELKQIDPSFDPAGKSDAYVRGRLDHARENAPDTARAAELAMQQRATQAWKPSEQRTDSAGAIDPEASRRAMIERNAEAWKR